MKSFLRVSLLLAAGAALVFLSGCATPTQPAAMTAAAPAAPPPRMHPGGLSVEVTGGKATNPAWTSQISDQDFRVALEKSLADSGLFKEVLPGKTGAYHLTAYLARLDQPMMGFTMNVTMEVGYTHTKVRDGKVLWQKSIVCTASASPGDAFAGVKRLRLATERSAKKNIELLLAELAKLELP